MKSITVIDTFAFFFRAYFALPPLKSRDGFPTGLLTGFINFVHQLQTSHMTDYIVFAIDSKEEGFRKKLYSEYKANRPSPPEDLVAQLGIAIEWIDKMGFKTLSKAGYEADDVMATIMRIAKEQGIYGKMVSSDKDLYQLLEDDKIELYDWVKRKSINESGCIDKFGVPPKYFIDFQALLGDSSDNIPGVKGIGVKTASKIINEYHTLEDIYANIENCGTKRVQNLLLDDKENAFLSRELVTLKQDIFDTLPLEEYKFEDKNYLSALSDEFEKYGMNTALKWANSDKKSQPKEQVVKEPKVTFNAVVLDSNDKLTKVLEGIDKDTIIAFDTETTALDVKEAKLVGFSFAINEQEAYYVPIGHSYLGVGEQVSLADAKEAILKIFNSKVVGQNLKFDLAVLKYTLDIEPKIPYADTMILAWLLESGSRVGLDFLAKKFFNHEMVSFSKTVKKGENFSSVTIEEATKYAAEDAWMTLRLYHKLVEFFSLSDPKLAEVAREVEYPFVNTLIHMEREGIRVDTAHLDSLRQGMSKKLAELTQAIYTLSGTEFNIRSTQQLGVVLFQQLGLKGGKKTKTGYSTNEAVLRDLVDAHPVIAQILEYREYQKMLSTYVEPLARLAEHNPEHRIYTSFLQTGTATGRLSSRDPNLQNIPVRSELGRSVRRAFVAGEGQRLISIDYSQIELRLLAHYSGDMALREAFEHGDDIHLATATQLFGEDEARAKRNFAKSINFGLLYGMGARKLADELHITTSEAKEIIQTYFATFPTVKRYLEQIQDDAKHHGYVETLIGRRRVFDYENAGGMQKAAILREAVNTVFQGSAADLIKLSMLEIDRLIGAGELPARMLLQIHDELIFEASAEVAEEVAQRLREIMEGIHPLKVALECSVSIDRSWDKLK
jgi:DNA polymerase-1